MYKTSGSFVSVVGVYLYTLYPTSSAVNVKENLTIELIECDSEERKAIQMTLTAEPLGCEYSHFLRSYHVNSGTTGVGVFSFPADHPRTDTARD